MKVFTAAEADDLEINVALAKAIRGKNAQVHMFEGRHGMRVRVLTKSGAWRMVNWRAGWFNKFLRQATGCEIVEDGGKFRVKMRGAREVVADDEKLAVAMAAIYGSKPRGFGAAFN